MAKSIAVAAGGTLGHVMPALAVVQALSADGIGCVWFGGDRGEQQVLGEIPYITLAMTGMRGHGIMRWLKLPWQLLRSMMKVARSFYRQRPQCVLLTGGYIALPVGCIAWLLRIPVIIHEANAVPGMVNRWLAPRATVIATGFPGVLSQYPQQVLTGNPVRRLSLPQSPKSSQLRVLVLGGSQGAKAINTVVASVAQNSTDIDWWHQTGALDHSRMQAQYQGCDHIRYESLITDMPSAYAWADLIIARSGAMTVSEIAAWAKPAIFVPLPSAVDDHQTLNARYLAEQGLAQLCPQPQFTVDWLKETLKSDTCQQLIAAVESKPDTLHLGACERLREIVLKLSGKV